MIKRAIVILIVLIVVNEQSVRAQNPEAVSEQRIDEMFNEWSDQNKPGGAAAFIYNNELVYSKGFGMANLETGKLNNANTAFEVAAMSRHFTAFAILLLEDKAVISLDDDIRKYVPQVPDLGEVITLNHLLSQSSGLYDLEALRNLSGWDENDFFTRQDALKLLSRQKKLNFSQGTAFSYSETGTILLSEVIEKVTGQSIGDYAQENIFKPAGMTNTWFNDGNNFPRSNTAKAYLTNEEGTRKVRSSFTINGSGNLYTSVLDLAKWEQNLTEPMVGNRKIVDKLNSIVTLTSGKEFSTTQGNLTYGQQFYHKERGITELYRTGYLDGYASAIFKFDHKGFAAIVLSNDGSYYRGYLGMETAYLFLEDTFLEPATTDFSKMKTKKLKSDRLREMAGFYWDNGRGVSRQIIFENDSLYYSARPGNRSALVPLENDRFQMKVMWDDKIFFTFKKTSDGMEMEYISGDSDPFVFTRYTPVNYSENELKDFEGSYYNEAYNIGYKAEVKEGSLVLSNLLKGDIELMTARRNHFIGDAWFLRSIHFKSKDDKEIEGFNVAYEGIRNLWFKKVE